MAAEVVRQGSTIEANENIEAWTIEEFCRAYSISRSALYGQWKQGTGPRYFKVGDMRRISRQAGLDWVRQLEQATAQTPVDDAAA